VLKIERDRNKSQQPQQQRVNKMVLEKGKGGSAGKTEPNGPGANQKPE